METGSGHCVSLFCRGVEIGKPQERQTESFMYRLSRFIKGETLSNKIDTKPYFVALSFLDSVHSWEPIKRGKQQRRGNEGIVAEKVDFAVSLHPLSIDI